MTARALRNLLLALILIPVLLYGAAGVLLSQGKTLGERHDVPPTEAFDFANGNFADYVAHARRTLQQARLDAPPAEVIDNLAPFVFEPDASCPRTESGKFEKGAVLIHGLFDSPYSMRPFGEALRAQCFYVLGLLLPDHGTRPGDFLDARWQDWAEATHFAATQLAQHAEALYMAGHSAGGTLSLLEAARNPDIDALILFAPALGITPAAKYARYVQLVGKLFKRAAWYEVRPDDAVYRYESLTFHSAAEMFALIEATMEALAETRRDLPVFTVASMQDSTVSTQRILDYMEGNTHPASHTLLYSQYPYRGDERTEVVISNAPVQRVLSVSHLGLMTPPSDPYYGRAGRYRNCGHYGDQENPLYVQCKSGRRAFYGEATPDNLAQGLLERIAFNPFYDAMLVSMQDFLQNAHKAASSE
ncbi:MAG: alpha/beta hydrolase [Gammaproteobacteria bacterium]